MKKIICQIYLLVTCFFCSYSQVHFTRDTTIKIFENSNEFEDAWSGGLNSAQFSEIDLNLDGNMDLIIFDKSGRKLSPYLNINGKYIYSPNYKLDFPVISDWMILKDYNCDGKQDIFTSGFGLGIAVYKNTSTTSLSFSLSSELLYPTNGTTQIYVSREDIPAFSDIDYDGDLDILSFGVGAGFIIYYKNTSMENYGNCDSLEFQIEDGCWGKFYEDINNTYILNCPHCPLVCDSTLPIIRNNSIKGNKHGASSLLAIDIDDDNDKDLIVGDDLYNNLTLLINGGDNQNALMISSDSSFPSNNTNTIPVDLYHHPAAFYIDLTHDGKKDLIVSTNKKNNAANYQSCWIYNNTGSNNNPEFHFLQDNFIQSETIDLGEGAFPVLIDINNDSLLDLFIGNYGYYDTSGTPSSKIAFFQNLGTKEIPEFHLINRDFAGISNINLNILNNSPARNIFPTFGDLDGDGDQDLIVGDDEGKIHLFTNNASIFNISQPNYFNIDVGTFAAPQIIDVNRDGLNDLIIGSKNGTITYFENTGTITNPDFSIETPNWGGVDVDDSLISNSGFSTPELVNVNNNHILFVGSWSGRTYQYNNIDSNLNGIFNLEKIYDKIILEGYKNALAIADINNDNILDMIMGNLSGGIAYFRGDSLINSNILNIENTRIKIYPNPAQAKIYINNSEKNTILIYNIMGELLIISRENEIDVSKLSKGIYLLKVNEDVSRFIKQ